VLVRIAARHDRGEVLARVGSVRVLLRERLEDRPAGGVRDRIARIVRLVARIDLETGTLERGDGPRIERRGLGPARVALDARQAVVRRRDRGPELTQVAASRIVRADEHELGDLARVALGLDEQRELVELLATLGGDRVELSDDLVDV